MEPQPADSVFLARWRCTCESFFVVLSQTGKPVAIKSFWVSDSKEVRRRGRVNVFVIDSAWIRTTIWRLSLAQRGWLGCVR